MMQAIVLAAGRGSRLGPLTDTHPKCLTRLAGRTLLDWQLDALTEAGCESIAVVRGYAREQLADPRYTTRDNLDWESTNMVASLRCAADLLQSRPCLVLYSDIVYHPQIVRDVSAADGELAMAYDCDWLSLWRLRFDNPLKDAETFRQFDGQLEAIGARAETLAEIQGQYMGILRFTPKAWREIEGLLDSLPGETARRLDMTGLLSRYLASGGSIGCVPTVGRWCEVDSAADLAAYETQIRHADAGTAWSHDWRWLRSRESRQ